jgi:superfamily II DNA or RNA helicase
MTDINVVANSNGDVDSKINIISYDLATREPLLTKLKKAKFQVIIVDEVYSCGKTINIPSLIF